LVESWFKDDGNFTDSFANAGLDSGTYATSQDALNALSDALFYVEKETKDMKLGIPSGLTGCSAETCPEALESPFAEHSKENIGENSRAFSFAYRGTSNDEAGTGFRDLLLRIKADDLAGRMDSALDKAQTALDDFDGSMEDA